MVLSKKEKEILFMVLTFTMDKIVSEGNNFKKISFNDIFKLRNKVIKESKIF